MRDINDFVFVDTETSGLDEREHNVLEISYAVGDGEVITFLPPYFDWQWSGILQQADPVALEINEFIDRYSALVERISEGTLVRVPEGFESEYVMEHVRKTLHVPEPKPHTVIKTPSEFDALASLQKFIEEIKGKTWVGANPRFDLEFVKTLANRLHEIHEEDWYWDDFARIWPKPHHRLFDISTYFAGQQWLDHVPSWGMLLDHYKVDNLAQHTAAGDVIATRDVFKKMLGYSD